MHTSRAQLQRGVLIIQVLVFAAVAVVLLTGLVGWSGANIKGAKHSFYREQAFQIAEAGIEYYRWHLAHFPADFQDGTGAPGPYIHAFNDKDGNRIGQFELQIIPPPIGSTAVTLQSKGTVDAEPGHYRRVQAVLAKESFAKYALLLNSAAYFGPTAEVFGPIHANGGLRFDGTAHNLVTSGVGSYDDPEHGSGPGGANLEFGVHTHRNPPPPPGNMSVATSFRDEEAPPEVVTDRSDVFLAGRNFPAPAVDFTGLTQNLSQMKTDAIANGFYRAASGAPNVGYHVVLKTNDTFDLFRVTNLAPTPGGCRPGGAPADWGLYSIQNEALIANYPFPPNGIVFLEDDVWVSGQVSTGRLTIVAGLLPAVAGDSKHITVNNDLLYTAFDGSDSLALIAQGDFNIGLKSEDDLTIDAALIAQNGRVGRYDYQSNSCGPERFRTALLLYGTIASNLQGGFCDGSIGENCTGSGYVTRTYQYDPSLLYAPPPSFPLTSDQYQTLSWQEIK